MCVCESDGSGMFGGQVTLHTWLVQKVPAWQSQEKISLYQYEEACVQEVVCVCVLPTSLCGVL